MFVRFLLSVCVLTLTACQKPAQATAPEPAQPAKMAPGLARATFAGGCFWCIESDFDDLKGVISATSGYIDGGTPNPTYKQVSAGTTGHTEALEIIFDPKVVTYAQLVERFWRSIDPTQANGQFCDRGTQYRTGIYWHNAAQKAVAQASRKRLEKSGALPGPIVTDLKGATRFYIAETYHQDYHRKNPAHYQRYRKGCGRDARLRQIWGAKAGH